MLKAILNFFNRPKSVPVAASPLVRVAFYYNPEERMYYCIDFCNTKCAADFTAMLLHKDVWSTGDGNFSLRVYDLTNETPVLNNCYYTSKVHHHIIDYFRAYRLKSKF